MPGEFSVETLAFETPKVIKNLTKEYSFEKTIAIQELKVALMKSTKELYPSELLDVVEEFLEGVKIDEPTIKYEHFRMVKDEEALLGSKLEAPPQKEPEPEVKLEELVL
jgi:hypothetical protein